MRTTTYATTATRLQSLVDAMVKNRERVTTDTLMDEIQRSSVLLHRVDAIQVENRVLRRGAERKEVSA